MYEDPGDYTELRTDTSAIYLGGEIHRGCINIHITDDILLEEVEFFSVQAVPPEGGLPQRVFLDPDLTFVEIMDNDCKCLALIIIFSSTFNLHLHAVYMHRVE